MNDNKKISETIANLDAVKMMREIREKLSMRYWKHPEILKKEMEDIRKKYQFKVTIPE